MNNYGNMLHKQAAAMLNRLIDEAATSSMEDEDYLDGIEWLNGLNHDELSRQYRAGFHTAKLPTAGALVMDHTAPPPFNPHYDPSARKRYGRVTQSMEDDGYYDDHTREECSVEWKRRYDAHKSD